MQRLVLTMALAGLSAAALGGVALAQGAAPKGDAEHGKKIYVKGPGFTSLYGSSKVADDFNVANGVYKAHQDIDSYLDSSFTNAK